MDDPRQASAAVRPAGAVAPRRPLWTVQVLRCLAALMVVAGHTQSAVQEVLRDAGRTFERSHALPWGAGVDLFFVISGFIIVHASTRLFATRSGTGEFVRRRLARIVPLYWLVTTVFLLLLVAASLKGGDPLPGAAAIIASYAFVPADTFADGRFFPIYDLGWTLNYEMLFYALLAPLIALPRRRALVLLGVALCALVLAGRAIVAPSAAWFWTRPIILDFGLGVVVGAMVTAQVRLGTATRLALAAGGALTLIFVSASLFESAAGATVPNEWPRVLLAGVPAAALLAAGVLGAEPSLPRAALPLTRIGDASYSLYLLHPFALIVMEKLAQKLPAVRAAPGWLLALATIVAAVAIALAGYRWLERPFTDALNRRFRAWRAPGRTSSPERSRLC